MPLERTGSEMTEDNIWLTARRSEIAALNLIIDTLSGDRSSDTVQGAGTLGRDAIRKAAEPRTPVDLPLGPIRTGRST